MVNIPEVWVRIVENETVRKGGSCKGLFSEAHGCGLPKAGTISSTLVSASWWFELGLPRSCHSQTTPLDMLDVHQGQL